MHLNLTVGAIDRKEVVFVGPELDLITIPKAILPDWLQSGQIVQISLQENITAEVQREREIQDIQRAILRIDPS